MTTEVTQAQWKAITGQNPSDHVGDDLPVHNLAWNEITTYMRRLKEKDGKTYRLPTEAEWEYACRAGAPAPTVAEINEMAWYRSNSSREPHPVATKKPNAWGLYDMYGNAWEWTADFYGDYPAQATDPFQLTQLKGNVRVLRGGSWSDDARILRPANRNSNAPGLIGANFGFRLVLNAD
jgi:formylglycine-generating enzyme required for sulfatase activity